MKRRGALALMALGILLAGGASVIVLGIARQAGEASRAVIPQVYVVMAAREIPDQAIVTPDALVVRPFPAEFAPVGAVSQPEQAVGKFAVGTIYKDQILMSGHVSTGRRAPSLSDRVPAGRVVVWLPMPELIAGQVGFRPGDRLDILLSMTLNKASAGDQQSNSQGLSTQVTLQNVEIFAIGEQIQTGAQPADKNNQREGPLRTAAGAAGGSPGRDHHQVHQGLGRRDRPRAALVG